MNIDERIKKELESESAKLDEILAEEPGLFGRVASIFKGSLKIWVIFVNVFVMFFTVIMIWMGYEFFVAMSTDDRIFYGVIALAALKAQVSLKEWLFSEMRRSSLMREIKRLELSIEHLQASIKS
ncbi:DUF6768 family protein [Kangiella sp. HZ709]|uniref:DUF6768 family protein n=1 Tax=Kangiella sp. HZ709 TaxID=2666328 RepID=UPI0012B0B22A|nr:DUF6768 family protein [Kangiella sp. HZ709]MRX27907.1 hypothetical protein [Kangiella sp. HZ709]